MAKCGVILLCFVCFFSFLSLGYGEDWLLVEGEVYCDTCRAQIVTKLSQLMSGAKVKLECRNAAGRITYRIHNTTDHTGTYRLPVNRDHSEDFCAVFLVKSSRADCKDIIGKGLIKQSVGVDLSNNNGGLSSPVRKANPLSFQKKKPLSECRQVLRLPDVPIIH